MAKDNVIDLTRTNVFAVTDTSLITLDMDKIAKVAAERRKAEDEAWVKAHPPDENQIWRNELEELERRLRGYITPEDATRFADQEADKHKAAVAKLADEIHYVTGLLETPGLDLCQARKAGVEPKRGGCGCDGCVFHRRISLLTDHLTEAKRLQQKSIRTCGGMIATAKELSKLVPRYQELATKAKKIETARKVARGMIDGHGGASGAMQPGALNPGERLRVGSLGFEPKSPHIKWDK